MKKIPMTIIYDFDGTLIKGNMQESHFLPEMKIKPKQFWKECKKLAKDKQADETLMYMYLMLEKAKAKDFPIRRESFELQGNNIELFQGVESWFERINKYGKTKNVEVEHVILSSGNKEIIDGMPIKKQFQHIYASEFHYNASGVAVWPALAINYTNKTQYLFRVNKGVHDISDNAAVNKYVPKNERPVPFENMVFIGDGDTDVPCFRLVKEQGGLSIAVYQSHPKKEKKKAEKYIDEGRVHCAVTADYRKGERLEEIIKANIDKVASCSHLARLMKG
jgi:phosphoserine phosphatase